MLRPSENSNCIGSRGLIPHDTKCRNCLTQNLCLHRNCYSDLEVEVRGKPFSSSDMGFFAMIPLTDSPRFPSESIKINSRAQFPFQLTGRGWFWRGWPCSQWWRNTVPGLECRSCRRLLPSPRLCSCSSHAGTTVCGRSAPRDAGSAAGRERSGWWASAGWCWSGRNHLKRESQFSSLHLTAMKLVLLN